MQKVLSFSAMWGIAISTAACAIRPDVKQYAKIDTYAIIRHVRCELRDAVRSVAKRSIERINKTEANKLDSDEDYVGFDFRKLGNPIESIFTPYANTIIGSEFTFDITEHNNASADVDILHSFTRGALGLGAGVGKRLSRNSVEKSKSIDVFERLATHASMSDENYCRYQGATLPVNPNFAYPITGKLDLEPVVTKFFDYNQSANLGGTGNSRSDFSITLKFTTTIDSDISASARFPPRGVRWQVSAFDATADASRADVHMLSIAFSIPVDSSPIALTLAEERVEEELRYLRNRDDLRTFGGGRF